MAAGASPPTKANRTPNTQGPEPGSQNMWAKLCVREGNRQPRPPAKAPKSVPSGKGCASAQTTRMLAQKQPPIQRVRNSSLVEWTCADNIRG